MGSTNAPSDLTVKGQNQGHPNFEGFHLVEEPI